MPHFIDLASVFQLGAGVSLAFSVFKEPVSIAEERLRSKLERQLKLLTNSTSADVNDKRQELLLKRAELRVHVVEAEALAHAPKKLIWVGVFANFILLFASVIWSDKELTAAASALMLAASTLPYFAAVIWLQLIAAYKIGS